MNMDEIRELAAKGCWTDNEDFCVDDYAGGNFDDAFWGGWRAGRVELAREVVEFLDAKAGDL